MSCYYCVVVVIVIVVVAAAAATFTQFLAILLSHKTFALKDMFRNWIPCVILMSIL